MKFSPLILGLTLLALTSARAQVSVEVVLDQEQFLPRESVPAAVRITNRSGQTLHFPTTRRNAEGAEILRKG